MDDNKTKKKIIDAMYALVAKKGYDKASMGQIADAVGIKKASVYYYFKSKEEIFLQLASQLYTDDYYKTSRLFEQGITADIFKTRLLAFGDVLIDSYFEDKDSRKVYAEIDLQSTRIEELQQLFIKSDEEMYAFLTDAVKQGVALGAISQNTNIIINAQLLYTLTVGIDSVILYNFPGEPRLVWREAVSKLFI